VEHRVFLKSLSAGQRQSLTRRDNHHAALRLLVLSMCFVVCVVAIVLDIPFLLFWLIVQGLLLISLFHLMHECIHDTVFRQRWLNRLLAHVCGFILFLPAIWFRHFHHAHHRYTQQINKDPELSNDKPSSLFQWLVHVSGIVVWRDAFALLLKALYRPVRKPYLKEKYQVSARWEMIIMLGAYVVLFMISIVLDTAALLYLWIIPLLLGQPFLRLYLLAEHTGCEAGSNMLANTRTVLTSPIVRWFTWNMPYHTEHHVYPSVPFHQLPRLHRLMQSYLVEVDPGYTHFNVRFVRQLTNS